MARNLDNWLASYMEYSESVPAPELFRRWTGISCIAAALQRKTFAVINGQHMFPNFYILLVGGAGVGKGNAMKVGRDLMVSAEIALTTDSLTKRNLYTQLERHNDANVDTGSIETQCALTSVIEELGVFMHPGDFDFLYALQHLYDCPPSFKHETQHSGHNSIENVYYNFIAGATPSAIRDILTEQAMQLGISARTIMIYSDVRPDRKSVFGVPIDRGALKKDLVIDLRKIIHIRGEYTFEEDAANLVDEWVLSGMKPYPTDPRFDQYLHRRVVHFAKLCIVWAAAERDDPIVLAKDVKLAQRTLLDAEKIMHKAIERVGANPYLHQQQLALQHINEYWKKLEKGTPEHELRQMLSKDIGPQFTDAFFDQFSHARWVDVMGNKPNRIFIPKGKLKEMIKK